MRFASARSSGLVGEADDHLAAAAGRPARPGTVDRDDQQLVRAGIVDHVGLARANVRAGVRLEVVPIALELERAEAGDGVEQLVAVHLLHAAATGPARSG